MKQDGLAWASRGSQISRMVVGTRLFLVSYAPLWFIFLVLSRTTLSAICFLILSVAGVVDAFRLISGGRQRSKRRMTFIRVSDKSGQVAGYLATYLLPFIQGPPGTWREALAYGIYFLTAWAIFVPSDLGLVNPTLYLLGWRVVEVSTADRKALVVTDQELHEGGTYMVSSLMGNAGFVVRPDPVPPSQVAPPT